MERAKINKSCWIGNIVAVIVAVAFMVIEGTIGHFTAIYAIASICMIWASVFYFCQYFIAKRPKREKKDYKAEESQETGMIYRSKVDVWLAIILLGSIGLMIWFAVEPIVRTGKVEWYSMIMMVIMLAIILPLFDIKYILYSRHLLISMSFYGKVRIAYKDIVGVKATMNPISSAALSLKRLQIDYVENGIQRMILISPVRKKEFLEIMGEKCGKELI